VRRHTPLHTQSARGAHVDERDGVVEVPRTLLPPPLVPRDGLCLRMGVHIEAAMHEASGLALSCL
jgi:hypothetical protein